jgi:hypothetical protein
MLHDHVSYYFKSKLNICQHGFTKSKSTVTNVFMYLDFVTSLYVVIAKLMPHIFILAVTSTLFHMPFLLYWCKHMCNTKSCKVGFLLSPAYCKSSGCVISPITFSDLK